MDLEILTATSSAISTDIQTSQLHMVQQMWQEPKLITGPLGLSTKVGTAVATITLTLIKSSWTLK